MRLYKIVIAALVTLFLAPTAAIAADIPLLTWERGRAQQVVLGGGAYANSWIITLEGNGQEPREFSASAKNAAGYIVYSIEIPADYPTGPYSIVTIGKGSPRTVVAGVNLIPKQSTTVASNLFDLTIILAIFVFLTGIVSTIRGRKYTFIPFRSAQILPRLTDPIFDAPENFWKRLEKAPLRLRTQSLLALRPSLPRFLLIREGELAQRLSNAYYGLSPFVGLMGGVIAGIEVLRNDGIATTPMTVFILILAISIFDAVAGVAATLGFWAVQLLTGNITSVRDLLIALAIGFAWIGPSLFAALLRETINRDFTFKKTAGEDPIKILGVLGSSAVGAAVFYLGHALVSSVIYIENQIRTISMSEILIVFALLAVRGLADGVVLDSKRDFITRDESFLIARVSSPITGLLVFASIFGFVVIWTESAAHAAIVALLFSLPYLLVFIRFNKISRLKIERIQRNILLESAIISGVTFIAFREISQQPLLVDQRANLILVVAAVAPALHAIYSSIHSSNEEKFTFDANSEIMKP
jgi:hypothetical protein